jgi:hypothetical protein
MCVTCLGSNQHTHSSHKNYSAPLHNLNKHRHTRINTLVLNGNHRHVCMYANGKFISHTKLFRSKCDVGKHFYLFRNKLSNFRYLEIGLVLPKIAPGLDKL